MDLSNLKPADGSTKKAKKRVGRGQGSGKGGTATRGHKGAQSRSGYSRKPGFEGGQMPIQRRMPKRGFTNINSKEYYTVNLFRLQALVDEHKLSAFDVNELREQKLLPKNKDIKILGTGEFTAKVEVIAHAFSKAAQEAIEKAGGSIVIID